MDTQSFPEISRRKFLRNVALGTSALATIPILGYRSFSAQKTTGAARWEFPLNNDWRFGGKFSDAATQIEFDDSAFEKISLPHCVAKLSWHNWKFSDWSDVWIYRRHFSAPENFQGQRMFLHFDGVISGATPFINGQGLLQHVGGYLPFEYEITGQLVQNENVLAVAVDSRWLNAPPDGSPRGAGAVDFFEPGGITRPVSLRVVPQIFIRDVFAKPVNVLDANRRVEVACKIDAATIPSNSARVKVELFDAEKIIASVSQPLKIEQLGAAEIKLTLANLGDVKLWDVNAPQLYDVVVTLILDEKPIHDYRTRIGFREARFELDGFYLNGQRLQLFGLNRHELFPYVGFAMPPRVMRRDAEILKRELNCNVVRCSHYPQSENFLEACDELGLLVWEEIPGWSYIGNAAWQDLLVRDVRDMIVRDRNHPSIILWGVRVNESNDNPELYRRTTEVAKSLDDSRPASGAMVGGGPERHSTKHWAEEVFAYNDYHHVAPNYDVSLEPPLPNVPYLITEAVGQIVGPPKVDHKYRRGNDPVVQMRQAIYHAQVHDQALADKHYAGVVAWCAFEYGSPMNSANGIKCPGVVDFFRIPKLGASFYK
jgi:beta-galactosidase